MLVSRFFAVPYLPPDMPTFNKAYGLGDDFLFSSLDYENACDSSTVSSLIGPMMGGLSSVGFIAGPYGSILRFAEGIDSIRNLAATGASNTTEAHRAAAIVCGIAQLGGVIWIALVLVFTGALCVCAPLGSVCCPLATSIGMVRSMRTSCRFRWRFTNARCAERPWRKRHTDADCSWTCSLELCEVTRYVGIM